MCKTLVDVFLALDAARPAGGEDRSQYRRGGPGTCNAASICPV